MITDDTLAEKRAMRIIEKLEELYPNAECALIYSKPYELLFAARLSAQCTDKRVNMVTPILFERFPSLEAFCSADIVEIEEICKPCGLYKTKSKSLKECATQLIERYNGELPSTIEELTSLSGIGRKTANLIMGDIFHKPAVVADTHCIRICARLGLTQGTDPLKVEMRLREILPPKKSNDFCHRIVMFGRDVCTARSPKCESCILRSECDEQNNSMKK